MAKKNTRKFSTIFREEPEGGYTAIVPSLPGCVSYGETLEEAQAMIQDAITGYIASLKKHKEAIPEEDQVLVGVTQVSYA